MLVPTQQSTKPAPPREDHAREGRDKPQENFTICIDVFPVKLIYLSGSTCLPSKYNEDAQ